jgi:hypothetical protein
MSYLQDRTANPANMAAIMGIEFLAYFPRHWSIRHENAVKYCKDFLLCFTNLETYCVFSLTQIVKNDGFSKG